MHRALFVAHNILIIRYSQPKGWGFKRLYQSGNDCNAYYHECFLRGLPHLTSLMKRVQPNQGKLLPHVEGEVSHNEMNT